MDPALAFVTVTMSPGAAAILAGMAVTIRDVRRTHRPSRLGLRLLLAGFSLLTLIPGTAILLLVATGQMMWPGLIGGLFFIGFGVLYLGLLRRNWAAQAGDAGHDAPALTPRVDPRAASRPFVAVAGLVALNAGVAGVVFTAPLQIACAVLLALLAVLVLRASAAQVWKRTVVLSMGLAVTLSVQFLTGPFITSSDAGLRFVALFAGLAVPVTIVLIPFLRRIRTALGGRRADD
jgi:hypothetical protein